MMIFLLITVSYMYATSLSKQELEEKNRKLQTLNEKMQNVANTYKILQKELYNDLMNEFQKDLQGWNAEIDVDDNTIRFKEPEVFFDLGKSNVKKEFKDILDDFFPRYLKILTSKKYIDSVEELRIEGHTSSEWVGARNLDERYLNNASLSQARAFEVLKYCFSIGGVKDENKQWLIGVLRANGLSFAKPMKESQSSRRVEFRTMTKADKKIREILDIGKQEERQ